MFCYNAVTNAGSINDNKDYVNEDDSDCDDDGDGDGDGDVDGDGDGDGDVDGDVRASGVLIKEQGLRHLGRSSYLRL